MYLWLLLCLIGFHCLFSPLILPSSNVTAFPPSSGIVCSSLTTVSDWGQATCRSEGARQAVAAWASGVISGYMHLWGSDPQGKVTGRQANRSILEVARGRPL